MAEKAVALEYGGVDLSRVAQALDAWKDGMVDHEVAEMLKIPVVYVASFRKMVGLKPNFKHVSTRSQRQAATAMQGAGMPEEDIAKNLRVPLARLKRWLGKDGE